MKIAVALSGGMDSSTVARRLKDEGHEVMGLTLRLCPDLSGLAAPLSRPSRPATGLPEHGCAACVAPCACVEAVRAAKELGIRHEILDARAVFEEQVIQPFIQSFLAARTPNPCAWCNQRMKFGYLLEAAQALGAEILAFGHYAVREMNGSEPRIKRARDSAKDQTYFLALVPKQQFAQVWFPLGDVLKAEVKAQARAIRPEAGELLSSTEICFLQDYSYKDFIRLRAPQAQAPGEIVDLAGRVVGAHKGLLDYTIGQRRGLGVAGPEPYYVIRLDAQRNQVVIGPDEALWTRRVQVNRVNGWALVAEDVGVEAMIRYRQKPASARARRLGPGRMELLFDEPVRAVTPGQIAAVYSQSELLAGGEIEACEADR